MELFKRKQKQAEPQSAGRGVPLPQVTGPVILALILVFAGLYYLLVILAAPEHREQADGGAAARQAQVLADRVDGLVAQALTAVRTVARSPGLATLVAQATPEQQAAYGRQVANAVPGAVAVLLLPPGAEPPSKAVGLGFAAREMLSQVEKGKVPRMEAHRVADGQRYLNVVDRSPGAPAVRVLLTLDLGEVQRLLDGLKSAAGYAEVVQRASGKEMVVAQLGDAGLRRGAPVASESLQASGWTLLYWAPRTRVTDGLSPLVPVALAGAALLLMLVVMVAGRRLQKQLEEELGRLMQWAVQMVQGTPAAPDKFRLSAVRNTVDLWGSALQRAAESVPKTVVVQRAPAVEPEAPPAPETAPEPVVERGLDSTIFRAYDIRGVVGEGLTREVVLQIGRAIGSEAAERGEAGIVVARDGRPSGVALGEALVEGLRATGLQVVDLGEAPTPALYFATHELPFRSGVMVTGSHNPPEHNGLKIVLAGESLSGEAIQALRVRVENGDFVEGHGSFEQRYILDEYLQALVADVGLARPLTVVVDCGNGAASLVAPQMLRTLGCEVTELYCELDGTFPNHHPDPSQPQNLQDLIHVVKGQGAELGLAFDGDGDRLAVVTAEGRIIWPDRLMMLYAMDLLTRHPGADVLFDVKCSRHLGRIISDFGGRPVMCRTGHSLMKAEMAATGALLAGEMSGHIFFKERWFGFDDGLYAAARLLEILSLDARPVAEIFAALPDALSTPELHVAVEEAEKAPIMARLLEGDPWFGGKINTIDGLRVDFADGWGLVRPSNTTAHLVLRFEADNEEALSRIQELFRMRLLIAAPELELPF